jgi:hypothetical protein
VKQRKILARSIEGHNTALSPSMQTEHRYLIRLNILAAGIRRFIEDGNIRYYNDLQGYWLDRVTT